MNALIFFFSLLFADENIWMGSIALQIMPDGSEFTMKGFVSEETWVPLPGESGIWPYTLEAEGQPLLIVDKEGIPHTLLDRGHHTITGMFSWGRIPSFIRIPATIALVTVHEDNQHVDIVRKNNHIWFSNPTQQSTQNISIQRENTEDQLQTKLHIQHIGFEKEYTFPLPFNDGSDIFAIQTKTSFWLESNTLHLWLSEGEHEISIFSSPYRLDTSKEREENNKAVFENPLPERISVRRTIHSNAQKEWGFDIWKGHLNAPQEIQSHEESGILFPNELPSKKTFLETPEKIAKENPKQLDSIHTTLTYDGTRRYFSSFPLLSFGLWMIVAILAWKQEQQEHSKKIILGAFFCALLHPLSVFFIIGYLSLLPVIKKQTDAVQRTLKLTLWSSMAVCLFMSIAPTTTYTVEMNIPYPGFFWLDAIVVLICTITALALIGYGFWKQILLVLFCLSIPKANADSGFPLCSINVEDNNIQLEGQVHISKEGPWILPGPVSTLQPQKIIVNGEDYYAFQKQDDGFIALYLPKGISEVYVEGTLRSPFGLHFPQRASQLNFSSKTHQIEGLHENHSHEDTIFFWQEKQPQILTIPTTVRIDLWIQKDIVELKYSVQKGLLQEEIQLPTWNSEIGIWKAAEQRLLYASQQSSEWKETLPTPKELHISSLHPNTSIYVHCLERLRCTQNTQLLDPQKPITQETIYITKIPTQSLLFLQLKNDLRYESLLMTDHDIRKKNGYRASSLWLQPSIPKKKWTQIHSYDRDTRYFPMGRSHILFLGVAVLLCFLLSIFLARQKHSTLNLSEWIWIVFGSFFIHPLLIPVSILFVFFFPRWIGVWLHLAILGICIQFLSKKSFCFEAFSWNGKEPVLCFSTETLQQSLWIWILGILFLQMFQLSKQSVKVG